MSEGVGTLDDTLGATQAPSGQRGRADAGLERGTLVGRYVVLSRLGAGGMGVVYAAYDPELDRKVALKLLLPALDGAGEASEGRTRLLREAQALAKLQHPNVVTIHDVGEHEDRVWLAMEHVEGRTLGAWQRERPRSWAEVLDVLVRAGRGVAAAHAAGLLHRDLKPDNVMVAADGRVRVMDFGLARTRGGADEDGSSQDELKDVNEDGAWEVASRDGEEGPPLKHEALGTQMTQSGTLLGTPAYMAPEQFSGAEVCEATDQFSLCVTLWEALYGERPFVGETLPVLMTRVLEGERRPPPRGARVPGWLRRVVERGLSVEAKRRWPSMEALLEALERGQQQARLRRGLGAAGLLGLVAVAVVGWQELERRRGVAACERAGHGIAAVWNEAAREELREALVGSEVSHAAVTADKVMPWLDAHARAWQSARTDACLDAEVHGTWDADVYERAKWCLDERRMELEALLEELSRGTPDSVNRAVVAAAGLERIEPCRERDLLVRTPTPPGEQREEVRAVRAELSRAEALERTGAYEAGLEVARAALERAEALAWPPLAAAARLRLGSLLEKTGAYAEAEEAFEAAYFEAATGGADEVVIAAAEQLVFVVGYRLARHAEALRWSRMAEVGLAALPDITGIGEARHLAQLASVHRAMGEHEEAKALQERALSIWKNVAGPEHPEVAMGLNNLAEVHGAMGRHEEAMDLFEQALAIQEESVGPEHPNMATGLSNLAFVHQAAGRYEHARALQERALAIREKALGPEHPEVATDLNNLASVHHATGSQGKAKALQERALAIREKALGPEHPEVATDLNNLAEFHGALGRYEEAKALQERALAIREKALGPEHLEVAESLNNLAAFYRAMRRYEEAKALQERALAIWEEALGQEHPAVATGLNNLALVYQGTGKLAEAKALQEQALAIWEKALGPEHPVVATGLHNLGSVQEEMGAYDEARTLYEGALAIRQNALGPEHPQVARTLLGLARTALEQERVADAVAFAERAVKIRENADVPAEELATARFLLARATWDAGEDRSHARGLAEAARDGWRKTGRDAEELAEIEAWLAERQGSE